MMTAEQIDTHLNLSNLSEIEKCKFMYEFKASKELKSKWKAQKMPKKLVKIKKIHASIKEFIEEYIQKKHVPGELKVP
jgi:hypothetical protein